jgi:chromosome segregation ATPase
MDYLSYLNKKDNNRRRKKNLVIYALYFLIPVLLLASTYTNEKIIKECDVIYKEKVKYEQVIKEKEARIIQLVEVCSTQVDSLSRLLGISTGDMQSISEDFQEALDKSSQLDDALDDAVETQAETDAKLADALALIDQLQKTLADKNREIELLKSQLATCETTRDKAIKDHQNCEERYNNLREENDALKKENTRLKTERDRFERNYNTQKDRNTELQEKYDNMKVDRDRYKTNYNNEKKRYTALQTKYKDLKKDHDILDRNYYQTKTKYDRLLQEKSRVTIEVVSSIPGNDFMWIENDIRYKVSVNGKAVKYLRGDPCLE